MPVLAPAGPRVLLKPVSNRVIARKLKREHKIFFFGSVTLTLRRNSIEISLRIAVHVLLYSKRTRARKRLLRRLGTMRPRARSIQPKFPKISVQNSMDRFGPTGKVSKKLVHLLRWSSFLGRTGMNFGWMDRAPWCLTGYSLACSHVWLSVALRYSLKRFSRDEMSDTTGKVRKLYKQLT